jgi:rhodanese-related sulfurtransferase
MAALAGRSVLKQATNAHFGGARLAGRAQRPACGGDRSDALGARGAGTRQPVLIALDDLQWADGPTLLALASLSAQLFSYPIAWLLALRPLPITSALDGLMRRLKENGAVRLHLRPLDASAAVALARDVAGPGPTGDLAGLVARAEGNPLYIIELLRADAAAPRGRARAVAGAVPEGVRAAVNQHLRSLSHDGRQLLRVASVTGTRVLGTRAGGDDCRAREPANASGGRGTESGGHGGRLIDIRAESQISQDGAIPGALVIPRNVLAWRLDLASDHRHPDAPGLDDHVIVICDEGYQSSLVATTLQQLGFTRATDLAGGFQAWRAVGFPVTAI